MRRALENGERYEVDFRIVWPDGGLRWLRGVGRVDRNETGRPVQMSGIVEDITERVFSQQQSTERWQAQEREMERLLIQKEALVREVHHRIKNNLQGIVGLLRQRLGEYGELRGLLSSTISQVESIAQIHGLQGYSRRVNLCDLVLALSRSVGDIFSGETRVAIDIRNEQPVQVREQDMVPVTLIINELLVNALKHGAMDEAAIRLTFIAAGGRVRVAVMNKLPVIESPRIAEAGAAGTGLKMADILLPQPGACLSINRGQSEFEAVLDLEPPVVSPIPAEAGRSGFTGVGLKN